MMDAIGDISTGFRRLGMAGAVLHLGAHPDDEDPGLITYMAGKHAVRTVYWSATRGEGGQNRIGPYKAEALGIYRTWETLAARAIDGGEALFGPLYDFGFAKSGEDTLRKWGREVVLRELVRAIRFVQPHVVIARWTGAASDGHGHHQAVGALVPAAFEAAADPEQCPELAAQGLGPWSATKLYASTGGDWQPGEVVDLGGRMPEYETAGYVRINAGEFDPVLGCTYHEQACAAFNRHQTQGVGIAPERGDHYYYYRLVKSRVPVEERERTVFEGFDPTLSGLADDPLAGGLLDRDVLQQVKQRAARAFRSYLLGDLRRAAELLLESRSELEQGSQRLARSQEGRPLARYLSRKVAEFNALAVRCLGLKLECLLNRARISPGQAVRVAVRLWNPLGVEVAAADLMVETPNGWEVTPEAPPVSAQASREMTETGYRVSAPVSAELSCPYWLRRARPPYRYHWPDAPPLEHPFGPPLITARCRIDLGRRDVVLSAPGQRREAFPGGYRELLLSVIPPISLRPESLSVFLPTGAADQEIELVTAVRSNATDGEAAQGVLMIDAPPGWRVTPSEHAVVLPRPDDVMTLRFAVRVPADAPPGQYPLRCVVRCSEGAYDTLLEAVRAGDPNAPGQPDESTCTKEEFVTRPAVMQVHLIDAAFARGYRYAYVKGAAEPIIESLAHFGLQFHLISDDEIGYLALRQFDAVVIGPNAYLTRDELRKNASRFLDYVAAGGTLIVQYQGYPYQAGDFCPYPFRYNQPHDRVTFSDAPVTLLQPDHFVFHVPNRILAADFADWVHDRGMYFFGEWDPRYDACLACNDPGEEPKEGGLLIAGYGRGTFVYVGYSFHRQIPAGVPGAFRLFANLLGIPEARVRHRVAQLQTVPVFADLGAEQLQQAARVVAERWEPDGAYLCHEGEPGHELFLILSGEIEVIKESVDPTQVIYRAGPGEAIGELAVLADLPRTAALRAKGGAHLLSIEGGQFRALMHANPAMTDRIIRFLVRRLSGIAN
jgi:LmbE family N-acetylglucosaminyl deacetylase